MKICRVVGNVVAAAQHPAFSGHKLMLVKPETADGRPLGAGFLAVDRVQAGPGDRVLVMSEGNGVRQMLGTEAGPIRSLIVGRVDAVSTSD